MGTLNKKDALEIATYKDVEMDNTPEKIGSGALLYSIEVNNKSNTDLQVLHIWDASSVPSFGDVEPDWIFPVRALKGELFVFRQDGNLRELFTDSIYLAVTPGTNVNKRPSNKVLGTVKTDGT